MVFKKITYSLPALKTLLETKNSCVYCIENCHRSLTILPAQLGNLKSSVHEYLSSKVTTCDPELQGIILSHKNVKIIDSVQLNDDGNYRLHYIADTYIFKPSNGSLLTGVVNKKSGDHLGVLVHSVFNASIPRPRVETGCPKAWAGAGVQIGQQVTFEVIKVHFTSRLPYIKGKLIDVEEKYNEDGGDSGIGGHDSTEEGNSYRNNFEKPLDFNENVKKKKKKKRSASGDDRSSSVDFEETLPSTSHSLPGRKNSSNLSELQSLLLNEAIATVSNASSQSEKKKKETSGLLPFKENGTSAAPSIEGGSPSKSRKRKRESSLDLGSSVDNRCTSSLDDSLVHEQHPKVKKKKLFETTLNGEQDLDEECNKISTPEQTERKKKKKKMKDDSNELENINKEKKLLGTDVESTIESLLSFATDSLKPKKKKKKSSLPSHQGDTNDSSILASSFSYDIKESPDVTLGKKKKSCDKMENSADLDSSSYIADTAIRLSQSSDNAISEVEPKKKKKKKKHSSHEESDESSTLISDLSSSSLQENKKKEKKKKKSISHGIEFLQMENDCIAELLGSKHSEEVATPSEKKKKKKSRHSDVELDSSIVESDELRLSQMPPPATTKIKKRKSSVISFTNE